VGAQVARQVEALLAAALERLVGCGCLGGCAGCVHMPGCGDYNEGLEKPAAIYILARLLGRPCNALPWGGPLGAAAEGGEWACGVGLAVEGAVGAAAEEAAAAAGGAPREPSSAGRCVICLDSFQRPTQTRCGHRFCLACIQTLLGAAARTAGVAARCPVCRMPCDAADFGVEAIAAAPAEPAAHAAAAAVMGGGGSAGEAGAPQGEWAAAEAEWDAVEAEARGALGGWVGGAARDAVGDAGDLLESQLACDLAELAAAEAAAGC
jgi:hypothetical protein